MYNWPKYYSIWEKQKIITKIKVTIDNCTVILGLDVQFVFLHLFVLEIIATTVKNWSNTGVTEKRANLHHNFSRLSDFSKLI